MLRQTALLVAAVLGVHAVTSCSTDSGPEGSGTEASNVPKVPSFNAVAVSGQADAVVTVSHARKVTVRGDDNLLEHVAATDSLTASVSGVGDVVYSGNPERVEKDVSGVGEVRPQR